MMKLGGIVSGLDTQNLITKLMEIERQPIVLMQNRQTTYKFKKELWEEINSSLLSLKTKNSDLLTQTNFTKKKATSSDETALTAMATETASSNTYNIQTNILAKSQRVAGAKLASSTAALNLSGTFVITDGTYTSTISVTNSDTLTTIMNKINAAKDDVDINKDLQVTASIVDNTLVLQHDKTGAANTISVIDGVDTPGSTNADEIMESLGILKDDKTIANQLQAAVDAQFIVNGITITRDKNDSLTDVINGVTLNLKKEGSSATLTVANDVDSVYNTIQAFVDQYNSTIDLINTRLAEQPVKNATSDAGKKKGLLKGDSVLVGIKNQLRMNISQPISGLTVYDRLSDIGITTTSEDFGKSGKLVVDETKLRDAINQNPDQVAKLFLNNEDLNGNSVVDNSEKGVAQKISDQLEYLTSSSSITIGGVVAKKGIVAEKLGSFDKLIDDYDDKIDAFEERIKMKEATLWNQFNAMEKALSNMNNQATWLAGQLSSLNNNK